MVLHQAKSLASHNFSLVRAIALFDYDCHKRPTILLRRLSSTADKIIKRVATQCALPSDISLIALGGYGRREIFPQSDLDLLLLVSNPATSLGNEVSNFTASLWNHGLRISASVRSLADCVQDAKTDLAFYTAMLESRLLKGDKAQFNTYFRAVRRAETPQAFFAKKLHEREVRHTRHQTSTYTLQPDCKNSPGGLRDIHLIFWIARAAGYEPSWSGLQSLGLIDIDEAQQFRQAELALTRLRIKLHQLSGRPGDQLLKVYQEPLAHRCGFMKTSSSTAAEMLLQDYQITAAKVLQLTSILFERMQLVVRNRQNF